MKLFQKSKLWIEGLQYAFSKDRNLFIQTFVIIVLLITLEIYLESWVLIKQTILFGSLVIILELINTTIELICDFIHPEWNIQIKRIKDIGSSIVAIAILTTLTITAIDIWVLVRG
ncbi:MAG: diacylglycerol kinase [Candidatus Paceibacterota bacterium]